MKSLLAYLWQRRWRFFLGAILALVCLPLLHPFVRQALFGPTIDGIPWCYWEDTVRHRAHPERAEGSWLQQMLVKTGLFKAPAPADAQLHIRAAIPVLIHCADDRDVAVRRVVFEYLENMRDEALLPVFRRHLQDDDRYCRVMAACGMWGITKDRELKNVALPLRDDPERHLRIHAAILLGNIAGEDPELFDPLAEFAEDPDAHPRYEAVRSMRHFGKRGVPILRKAMRDPNQFVRIAAIQTAAKLGKDSAELIPDLLAFQNDPDRHVRWSASQALHNLDPERFPATAKKLVD
jgi:HEAT repeat protein